MNVQAATNGAINGLLEKYKTDEAPTPTPNNSNGFDVAEYLNKYGVKVIKTKSHGSSKLYCLEHCVFNSEHKNEAAIGQTVDGKLFYQCFHDSCKGRTWHDARQVISGSDRIAERLEVKKQPTVDNEKKITLITYGEISEMEVKNDALVEGLLGRRESLIISGPSGIGKSAFSNFLTLVAASPPPDGLWGKFKIQRPLTSFVVQSENGMAAQTVRLSKLFKASPELTRGAERVITTKVGTDCRLTGSLTDPDFQNILLDSLEAVNADILVLDPLISYHGEDENDNAAMRRSLDCLTIICDKADVSPILYHHYNKNGQTRGASSIRDWAANMLLMDYANTDDDRVVIKMTHDKARNFQQQPCFYLDRTPDLTFLLCEKPGGRQEDQTCAVVDCLLDLGGCVSSQTILIDAVKEKLRCGRTTAQRAIKNAINFKKIMPTKKEKNGASSGYKLSK